MAFHPVEVQEKGTTGTVSNGGDDCVGFRVLNASENPALKATVEVEQYLDLYELAWLREGIYPLRVPVSHFPRLHMASGTTGLLLELSCDAGALREWVEELLSAAYGMGLLPFVVLTAQVTVRYIDRYMAPHTDRFVIQWNCTPVAFGGVVDLVGVEMIYESSWSPITNPLGKARLLCLDPLEQPWRDWSVLARWRHEDPLTGRVRRCAALDLNRTPPQGLLDECIRFAGPGGIRSDPSAPEDGSR